MSPRNSRELARARLDLEKLIRESQLRNLLSGVESSRIFELKMMISVAESSVLQVVYL
jgi:hypothetical protein